MHRSYLESPNQNSEKLIYNTFVMMSVTKICLFLFVLNFPQWHEVIIDSTSASVISFFANVIT